MKNGLLKPADLVVALKAHLLRGSAWTYASLGQAVGMSASQAHAALARAEQADLFRSQGRRAKPNNLLEFLAHGVRFAFYPQLGGHVLGVPTAHAVAPLSDLLVGVEGASVFVWPDPAGTVFGQALEPLHRAVPRVSRRDPELYSVLALVDALRVGRVRDRELALGLLRETLS